MMEVNINHRKYNSFICKYFAINDYLNDSLLHNYLWFSDPATFNDPYDLNLNLILPIYKEKDFIRLAEIIIEKGLGNGNSAQHLANHFLSNPSVLKNSLQSEVNKIASSLGVSCFCQNADNLLMWSHYADRHKGICLKFDMFKDKTFFEISIKIDYPERYPGFDYLALREDNNALVQLLVGTKSLDWKYENEIRVAKPNWRFRNFRGKIPLKKNA